MTALLTHPVFALSLDQALEVPAEFWNVLSQMAPYLLFGFLMAGVLSVLISQEIVERHLGGRGMGPVVKSSLFGVPLPLCSCGVIPVTASLRRHGASPGATTAFLLSTPQTGVDSILVTLSLLGPVYAIFRPIAALAQGILGGVLVLFFGEHYGGKLAPVEACGDACCSDEAKGGRLVQVLHYGFVDLPRDIGKSLLVGLVIAGLISALIPEAWFAKQLGRGIVPMLVMMAAGIPVYVCATASVPIAAALIHAGVSPGAALVFLMTGPATNAAALTTIWKVLGGRSAIIVLITVAVSALGCGLALDAVYAAVPTAEPAAMHAMIPRPVQIGSAIVLLAVLGMAIFYRPRREPSEGEEEENGMVLSIKGMTCSHCVANVKWALLECSGVERADVSLEEGRAVVQGEGADPAALRQAIEDSGYTVEDVQE
jgi:hypothetical protein